MGGAPATPRGGGAPAPSTGGRGGARGAVLTFERYKTSKDRLEIDWDYPASLEIEPQDDGRTAVVARMSKLPREEAFAALAGDDPRPLLILRECNACKGTDDALLNRTLDNERTRMLTRWFHCVKLMHHVVEKDHTFAALFEGPRPPHVLVASPDGSEVVALPGDQSQSTTWTAMQRLLDRHYVRDAEEAVDELIKLLSVYDRLDSMEDQIAEQIDREIERRGPRSPKVRRLRHKLESIRNEKEEAMAREERIADLGLEDAPAED